MKNRNYIFNKGRLNKSEVEEFKNFDAVLNKVQATPSADAGSSFKNVFSTSKIWLFGALGAIVSIALFWGIANQNTEKELETSITKLEEKKEPLKIEAPFPEFDIPYEEYKISADRKAIIESNNGSKIHIDEKSFRLMDGQPVSGLITLKYREFHDPLSIFKAGIPLDYDSNGVRYTFESAGMFEIRAFQDGKPIDLIPEKPIEVELVSLNNDKNFNLYHFNETLGNWDYTGESKVIEEPFEPLTAPAELVAANNTSGNSTDLSSPAVVTEIEALPEPEKPTLPKILADAYSFEINFSASEFPELPKETIFQIDEDLSEFNPVYYDVKWDAISLSRADRDGKYLVTLKKNDQTVQLYAYPALSEEAYSAAWAKYNADLEAYEQSETARIAAESARIQAEVAKQREEALALKALEARIQTVLPKDKNTSIRQLINKSEKVVRRVVPVSLLGVHNADRPLYRVNLVPAAATVAIAKILNDFKEKVNFKKGYNTVQGVNTLLNFYEESIMTYSKKRTNTIWAVTQDKRIAIIEDFDPKRVLNTGKLACTVYAPGPGLKKLDELMN
ncbi:hypothetical protein GYB22_01780 [bacterium]|nr:hypothetical protein [bacterium]